MKQQKLEIEVAEILKAHAVENELLVKELGQFIKRRLYTARQNAMNHLMTEFTTFLKTLETKELREYLEKNHN